MKYLDILKNKTVLAAIGIFHMLLAINLFTILYVIVIENDVSFTNSYSLAEGIVGITVTFFVTLFFNTIIALLAFTKLRSTTVFFPFVLGVGITMFILIYTGSLALGGLSAVLFGIVIGIYYATFFYGPAIWFYFRFRMPYVAVGWLSILYLSTLLIANAMNVDEGGVKASLSLLRPDFLIISGLYYFVVILLLIIDNSHSLARWKKTPTQTIKLPWRTIGPVVLILAITTVITNFISPQIWRVLWEEAEDGKQTQVSEDDLNKDAKDGRSGNTQKKENADGSDSFEMNPNQNLQDEISMEESEGSIFFTVKIDYPDIYTSEYLRRSGSRTVKKIEEQGYYWKMENLDKYSAQKGFHNSMDYESETYSKTLKYEPYYTSLRDYLYPDNVYYAKLNQTVTMFDLNTNWVIGAETQEEIRLLNGQERRLYEASNGSTITEKARPWTKGDVYEVNSKVNSKTASDLEDIKLLKRVGRTSAGQNDIKDSAFYSDNNLYETVDTQTSFDNPKIEKLTKDIIKNETNRYDKSVTVRNYLLQNFDYDLKPGKPPVLREEYENQDRLEYFLFGNKKGYCVHFASAMVAMLRSVEVPARVVGGFTQGTYSNELDAYIVSGNTAHAWVEVYFDEYGWVIFDPTPPDYDEQEKVEKDTEESLTKKVKEEIKEMDEKAETVKQKYNKKEKVDPPSDFKLPAWMEEFAAVFAFILTLMVEILKYAIPLCLIFLIFGAIFFPPLINYYIEMNLSGKTTKRDERKQIMAYFKLIEIILQRYNKQLKRSKGETSLEFHERLKSESRMPADIEKDLFQAAVIYNRASFRHELHPDDKLNMEKLYMAIKAWYKKEATFIQKFGNLYIIRKS